MHRLAAILLITAAVLAAHPAHRRTHRPGHRPTRYRVQATAFCLHGTTAAGTRSHTGTAAADPNFLPMGTVVRVHDAGPYSGEYLITDTGGKVVGRHIDLRLSSRREARQFGKRILWVQVIRWGSGVVSARADQRAMLR